MIYKTFDHKMTDIWRDKFIRTAGDIANYGGSGAAPKHLVEYEENALNHLLYWEARLKAHKNFDLGAEMAKYEPNRPGVPCQKTGSCHG